METLPTDSSHGGAGDVPDDAIDVVERQLTILWRRARATSRRVARTVHPDLEPAAYGLMLVLQRHGQLRLTELAADIGVGKPSVSRQVSFLENLGLVQKKDDPSDGRAQGISLTRQGQEQLAAAQSARKAMFHEVMASWDPDDLQALGVLLEQLNDTQAQQDG